MTGRTVLGSMVLAISVGGIVAGLTGERRAVSLRIWLAAFAFIFVVRTLRRLFADTPVLFSTMRGMVAGRDERKTSTVARLRDLRALEALVIRARDNDRAFGQQLRPRLVALADHYLRLHHGIDCAVEPDKAAAALGEVAWLINPAITERTPTFTELDTFVQLLVRQPSTDTKEAA